MAASKLGKGGFAALANTGTSAAPFIIFDATGQVADPDGGACNVYEVTNLDTTNWVWVQVQNTHFTGTTASGVAIPILPGQTKVLQRGFNDNEINFIRGWTTAPNVASNGAAASGSVNICGGILAVK